MPARLLMLVLLTMLVGCATAYGEEAASTSSESAMAGAAKAPDTKKKKSEPAKSVDATEPSTAVPQEKVADVASAPPPPSGFTFKWQAASPTARYSFDVFLTDGTWIGPCVAVDRIGKSLELTFDGECPSSEDFPEVAIADVDDFMLCSAENDDWEHPICTHANWNHVSQNIVFAN